jgi:hypothetical protein
MRRGVGQNSAVVCGEDKGLEGQGAGSLVLEGFDRRHTSETTGRRDMTPSPLVSMQIQREV